MYIEDSRVGCGIKELFGVGYGYGTPSQTTFNDLVRGHAGAVIASLTEDQKPETKFLLDNGFKRIGRYKTNPNSGNKIALFVLDAVKKPKKKVKAKKAVAKKRKV